MFICWFCHQEKPETERIVKRIDYVFRNICSVCVEALVFCQDCNEPLNPRLVWSGDSGSVYCSTHFDDHFVSCYDCGDTFPSNEIGVINNHAICYQCEERYGDCERCGTLGNIDEDTGLCESCERQPTVIPPTTFIRNKSERNIGIEIEFFSLSRPSVSGLGVLKDDGSIRADEGEPHEFASFVSKGDAYFDLLEKACAQFKRVKAKVNKSCGLHVHLDVRDETDETRANIRAWWQIFESIFFAIVSPSRRNNNYTRKTSGLSERVWNSDRYHALNISAFRRHGTYEIRLHQGSINANKIKSWSTLLLNFFDTFRKVPATPNRLKRVKQFNDRDRMMYFYNSLSLPLSLRKYTLKRIKEFNRESIPILNLSKHQTPEPIPELQPAPNFTYQVRWNNFTLNDPIPANFWTNYPTIEPRESLNTCVPSPDSSAANQSQAT